MKRIGIVWIVLALLIGILLTSCSETPIKTYEKNFVLATPDNLHELLLERIDLSVKDLNLTDEESAAVKKYSKYGNVLRAVTYEWPGKSELLSYGDSFYEVGADIFEIEVISKILGVNIEIEQLPYDEALTMLEKGQFDIMPGVYPTTNLLNDTETFDTNTATDYLYAYSTKGIQINSINDLKNLRIGVVKNLNIFTLDAAVSLHDSGVYYTLDDTFETEYDALTALRNDEIDIIIQTFSTNLIYYQCYPVNVSQIFDEYASKMLFTKIKEQREDLQYIMSAIQKIYDYNDYMQLIKQDYMDMYSAMIVSTGAVFSYAESSYIERLSDTPIKVLAVANSSPYIYYDDLTGEWRGISYEVWDAVTTAAGIPYEIESSQYDSFNLFNQIEEGFPPSASVIIPMYASPEKEGYLIFSTPVVTDKFVIVGLHETENLFEIHDLANKKVGIVDGLEATTALKTYLPYEDYITGFDSNDELINSLLAGTIDYIVLSETEFNGYFYEDHHYEITIKYELDEANSSIAFFDNEDGVALQSIYNKVVPFIKSRQIIEEFATVDTNINQVMRARNRDMLFMFMLMFLVIILFLVYFIRRLTVANKKVREIAFVNAITGLQNRTAFYNDNTIASGSLIFVDLDDFKRINDVHGHDIGDMFAHEIAQRIMAIANEFDLKAYTMDIDSFILMDDGAYNEDKLVSISAKVLYEVSKSVRIYDIDHKLTASIGIAVKKDERGMEELFKKADTALYLAKERGKNRYVVASEDEFQIHRKKQFLNERLTKETIQNEIVPYFQPKVDIRDGKIIGVEALARWNSKEEGMLFPDEILPVLTENGLLPILDISILTKTCKIYVDWLEKKLIEPNFIISCNMSYLTIEAFDIVAAVTQIHNNLDIPYRALEIEIREADLMAHLEAINDKLVDLAKLGVNISIDNFMADKKVMTQISKLPINVIKLDKSLLRDGINKKSREVYELVSGLSRRLNIGLIVEGVETPEQIQLLKEIPIYRAQGYYYSKTVSKAHIENDLRVKYIYR